MTSAKKLILFLFILIFLVGCDSGDDPTGAMVPGLETTMAPGIFIHDENGENRGEWMNPIDGGLLAYPNPCSGNCTVSFDVQQPSHVKVWVVAAEPPGGDPLPGLVPAAGAVVLVPGGQPLVTLLDGVREAGRYEVVWNSRDGAGIPVATGFYRLYAQIGDELFFADQLAINGYDQHSIDSWLGIFGWE